MPDTKKPLVSIIIPSYNYGRFLGQTLDSVISQTYAHWECFVMDDGSTDDTAAIATGYEQRDERIKYIHQQNQGIAATRNNGLKLVTGDYVQFLDADDMLPPEKLEKQISIFEQNSGVDIVYGDALFFHTDTPGVFYTDRDGRQSKTHKLKTSGQGDIMIHRLCINNFIDTAAPLIKRSAVDRVGEFDLQYDVYEDWQYWFRAAVLGVRFLYCPGKGMDYYYRYGHTSAMSSAKKAVLCGIRLRAYMATQALSPVWKLYNFYRLMKLVIKKEIYGRRWA